MQRWAEPDVQDAPIGYVLSLEGADSIVTLGHLERAYAQGCGRSDPRTTARASTRRAPTRLATSARRGRELLREMERLGIILDVTHLCDDSLRDALDHFHGPVWASHSNCRSLVAHNRQFSDDHIRELVQRERGDWRRLRRVDARPRLGARHVHAGGRRGHARDRDRSHRPHLPARRQRTALSASDRISTARSARSNVRPTSTPLPTCRSSRRCSQDVATASRTSSRSRTATSSGSFRRPGARRLRSNGVWSYSAQPETWVTR